MTAKKPPTTLEYALLGLLHGQPQSGYDLRKVFETTSLGNYSSSPGTIYPALRRLEARGLILGDLDDTKLLRPRKVFTPTAAGRSAFRAWLRAGISTEDVARRYDELMLRFAFHWVLADAGASRIFLLDLARKIELYVHELEAQRPLFPPQTPVHAHLALDAGIDQYRAAARWARGAADHFKEDT